MTNNPQAFFLPSDLVERAFASIFERLDDEARQNPADVSYFESQRGCFERALEMFRRGLYPLPIADGAWLMPSETGPAIVHVIGKVQLSGSSAWAWKCGTSCRCRSRFHKHSAYMRAVEVAMELADGDDGDSDACPICDGAGCDVCDGTPLTEDAIAEQTDAPAQLGRRLALARDVARRFNEELFAA